MPQKYSSRNSDSIQKASARFPSDDDSNNSPDQDGDIVKIFAAFHDRIEKNAKNKQKYLSAECEKTTQNMSQLANELILHQKKEIEVKVNEYKRKFEELDDERLSIVKKLRSEEAKYLQTHDSIVVELSKIEVAQEETNQTFEKKFSSFINDIGSQLKSPIVRNLP